MVEKISIEEVCLYEIQSLGVAFEVIDGEAWVRPEFQVDQNFYEVQLTEYTPCLLNFDEETVMDALRETQVWDEWAHSLRRYR